MTEKYQPSETKLEMSIRRDISTMTMAITDRRKARVHRYFGMSPETSDFALLHIKACEVEEGDLHVGNAEAEQVTRNGTVEAESGATLHHTRVEEKLDTMEGAVRAVKLTTRRNPHAPTQNFIYPADALVWVLREVAHPKMLREDAQPKAQPPLADAAHALGGELAARGIDATIILTRDPVGLAVTVTAVKLPTTFAGYRVESSIRFRPEVIR